MIAVQTMAGDLKVPLTQGRFVMARDHITPIFKAVLIQWQAPKAWAMKAKSCFGIHAHIPNAEEQGAG